MCLLGTNAYLAARTAAQHSAPPYLLCFFPWIFRRLSAGRRIQHDPSYFPRWWQIESAPRRGDGGRTDTAWSVLYCRTVQRSAHQVELVRTVQKLREKRYEGISALWQLALLSDCSIFVIPATKRHLGPVGRAAGLQRRLARTFWLRHPSD